MTKEYISKFRVKRKRIKVKLDKKKIPQENIIISSSEGGKINL